VKLLLVCSSGGHLLLLHQLRPWWERHERSWVTFRKTDAESLLSGERIDWAHHPTQRNLRNLVRNLRVAWRVLLRERPDVVVSTGAGVAFPFFLLAKPLRIKTVFVEAYERLDRPSLTGRLCYPISDLMVLQWEEQRRFYPRGELVGALL
jgi:beta-1,4-N-acetylglucosaminyltransferase